MNNQFLDSIEGKKLQYWSRTRNQFLFSVKLEPRAKSKKKDHAREFRRILKLQMQDQKRRRFRSKIILEISFTATARNPPTLQKLVKNYLDLLHKPMPETDNLKSILFEDDSQIQVLLTDYNLKSEFNKTPEIWIRVYNHNLFLQDLGFAEDLWHRTDYDERFNERLEDERMGNNPFEELNELKQERKSYEESVGKNW